jgi:hypothetical protein
MENTDDELFLSKVPNVTIDEDLKKYRNSKFVMLKLKLANEILSESGMPDLYYLEKDAQLEADVASTKEAVNQYNNFDLEVHELNEDNAAITKYNSAKPTKQEEDEQKKE